MDKPVVIFTTFFEANSKIEQGFIFGYSEKKFIREEIVQYGCQGWNTMAISIALSKPPVSKLKSIVCMETEMLFCPTYEMLVNYKKSKDWDIFSKRYMDLLKLRKKSIHEWIDNLEPKVYFLCCWENTSNGANCHRKILYDAFSKSKFAKSKMVLLYSHGNVKGDFDSDYRGEDIGFSTIPPPPPMPVPNYISQDFDLEF